MNKDEYIKFVNEKLSGNSKKLLLDQINKYYDACNYKTLQHSYKIGDEVILKKGTLLHGTYKNIEGLKDIVQHGLIASWFGGGRKHGNSGYFGKYPSSVGVWNLKTDYVLNDYINFYSGGTAFYYNLNDSQKEIEVIPFSKMHSFINNIISKNYMAWRMEQTKEARFMPSLVQDQVQIGIIFNGNNDSMRKLLTGDILNHNNIDDVAVKDFVNEKYYDKFIIERKNKDDFFTDRESAILFGIPANFIEGILVGRNYEKDDRILTEIKALLPNVYICNLDGKVIVE